MITETERKAGGEGGVLLALKTNRWATWPWLSLPFFLALGFIRTHARSERQCTCTEF